jgi:type II secretory pathway component PulF
MDELTIIGFILLAVHVVVGYKRPGLAFVTAPVTALILGYAALVTETPDNMILAPTLMVVTWGAIAVSGRDRETRQWYHLWAWQLLIALALLLLLAVLIAAFSVLGAGFILPLVFVLAAAAVVASPIIYATVSRRTMVMHVFSTIGSILRQNLPLPMALDCATNGRDDPTAWVLRRLKSWLVQGYSLTEAVRRGYPECPARVLALLAAGERMDQLPAALAAIETDLKASAIESRRLQPVHPFYPLAVLAVAFVLLAAMLTFVVPQFQAILSEMTEGRLPAATRVLLEIAQPFLGGGPWVVMVWLGLAILTILGIFCHVALRKRRPERPYLRTWIVDSVKWFLPVVHWFERNRSMVQVVELLRLSLNAGSPVNEAIRGTLQLDVNACFRSRLVCWLQRVERGQNVATSARRCGLGAALAWAFEGGAQTGNTPAVLEMLESHYRSNYSYRVNLTRFILWPLGIIALGMTVGFIVYAMFSPAVQVLSSIAGTIYP